MIARELMTRHFPFVTADADLDYVAKLLSECEIGVVSVVDEQLAPIGIVTRSNLERASPAPAADLGPLPDFLLQSRRKAPFRSNGRALRDVMTAPAISIPSGAKLSDIAKLMQEHHLKRAPVVDGHKIVGVLLRREVLNALSDKKRALDVLDQPKPIISTARRQPEACDIATAEEFRELVATHERQLETDLAARHRARLELREQRIKELAAQRLSEGQWREMVSQARRGASAGMTEHMLIRFPSQLCVDGGRAINAPDPHWPETLRGEPADVFKRWRNELQPRGFKIAAQIIDFPEGLPGDAALFLIWGKRS
ncbi:MAG TPA: CBS domain-containing protein [Methylocystis sp.]|jgi:CBS domain-containing protein